MTYTNMFQRTENVTAVKSSFQNPSENGRSMPDRSLIFSAMQREHTPLIYIGLKSVQRIYIFTRGGKKKRAVPTTSATRIKQEHSLGTQKKSNPKLSSPQCRLNLQHKWFSFIFLACGGESMIFFFFF